MRAPVGHAGPAVDRDGIGACGCDDPGSSGGRRKRGVIQRASIWEIAIKAGLNRADFPFDPDEILASALGIGFVELPVVAGVAMQVAKLPLYHRDPFDRLLIAQAMHEPVRFFTADTMLAQYSELVTLIR